MSAYCRPHYKLPKSRVSALNIFDKQRQKIYMTLWELGLDQSEARAEARLIVEHVSAMSYAEQLISDLKQFPQEWNDKIATILDDRRNHRPIQYCLGEASFCGLKFAIEEGVLIPRIDTESLVQVVTDWAWKRDQPQHSLESLLKPLKFADLGVGSGVLAITLLKKFPNATCWGCDPSQQAIDLTRRNAELHEVADRLELDCSDWTDMPPHDFDVIVSNPPYIPLAQKSELPQEIAGFEPAQALFVEDEDGLSFYRKFASELPKHFGYNGGLLALECGDKQSLAVLNLLRAEGFKNIKIHKDANNLPRVVAGEPPTSQ
jgi:release factor glutamine methyltransferase